MTESRAACNGEIQSPRRPARRAVGSAAAIDAAPAALHFGLVEGFPVHGLSAIAGVG